MLQAADVSFAYGRPGRSPGVLHHVSLTVESGGFVGILGPNGSGKTTLLRLLSGTLHPTAGRVTLDGVDLHGIGRAALARRMAVVPQETRLTFEYSVLEVVTMGRYPHLSAFEIEGPADLAICHDAMAQTGTAHLAERAFTTLSGGEKQRVVIAAALAQIAAAPGAMLLLDEPTTALDLGYQLRTIELLRELQTRLGLTIAISTHDLNFAAALCRRLLLLREGRELASGRTEDVLTQANIAALYDVSADVRHHDAAGHVVVIPVSRTARL